MQFCEQTVFHLEGVAVPWLSAIRLVPDSYLWNCSNERKICWKMSSKQVSQVLDNDIMKIIQKEESKYFQLDKLGAGSVTSVQVVNYLEQRQVEITSFSPFVHYLYGWSLVGAEGMFPFCVSKLKKKYVNGRTSPQHLTHEPFACFVRHFLPQLWKALWFHSGCISYVNIQKTRLIANYPRNGGKVFEEHLI